VNSQQSPCNATVGNCPRNSGRALILQCSSFGGYVTAMPTLPAIPKTAIARPPVWPPVLSVKRGQSPQPSGAHVSDRHRDAPGSTAASTAAACGDSPRNSGRALILQCSSFGRGCNSHADFAGDTKESDCAAAGVASRRHVKRGQSPQPSGALDSDRRHVAPASTAASTATSTAAACGDCPRNSGRAVIP